MLLAEADAGGVAIVANDDKDAAVRDVMIAINNILERDFSSKPKEVFAKSSGRITAAKSTRQEPKAKTDRSELKRPWNWFRSRSG